MKQKLFCDRSYLLELEKVVLVAGSLVLVKTC